MGFDESTLEKAEQLEKMQREEFLKAKAEMEQGLATLRADLEPPKVDEPQSLLDKILRKLGLQRVQSVIK